jgi:hypothetical protein
MTRAQCACPRGLDQMGIVRRNKKPSDESLGSCLIVDLGQVNSRKPFIDLAIDIPVTESRTRLC